MPDFIDSPVTFPLGAPSIDQNTGLITVDMALNTPGYITQRLSDLTLQRFIVDQIFANSGDPVRGGAVIYDQITQNDLYTTNDVEQVAPGATFPIVGAERPVPLVATVSKYGGKFMFTDEAKRRNDAFLFDQKTQKLANTLVRKVNTFTVAQLEANFTALAGATTIPGNDWTAVVTGGASQSNNSAWPAADFAAVQTQADTTELGVTIDLWILNPADLGMLRTIYGNQYENVLASFGLTVFPSNRVAHGTAYALSKGNVGFLKYEVGLATETWREPDSQATWVQSSVLPVMGITNPYSIYKVTGLAG
jgi:hypothetical protein